MEANRRPYVICATDDKHQEIFFKGNLQQYGDQISVHVIRHTDVEEVLERGRLWVPRADVLFMDAVWTQHRTDEDRERYGEYPGLTFLVDTWQREGDLNRSRTLLAVMTRAIGQPPLMELCRRRDIPERFIGTNFNVTGKAVIRRALRQIDIKPLPQEED